MATVTSFPLSTVPLSDAILAPGDIGAVAKSGDTMSGDLAMGTHKVTGLGTPTASEDAATKGYVDSQTISVPTNLTSAITAPALNKANGYQWSVFAFNGGETERAKDTSIADYQSVMSTALATGEKVHFPKWEYPIRSLGLDSTIKAGVNVEADAPIDVVCASGARFIAGECFAGIVSDMIRLLGNTAPTNSTDSILTPASWRGGIMSGVELTAAHGAGAGFGVGLLDVSQYANPLVEGVIFDTGVSDPALNTIGCGYADTGLGMHANIGARIIGNTFRGFFDTGLYDNGIRDLDTLGTDPFSTTSGSATVTVTHTAHGMITGDRPGYSGATAVGGLTISGEYEITKIDADSYTITAASTASSTATGGGSAVIVTMPISQTDYMSIGGEATVVRDNYFVRCGNGCVAFKRNVRHLTISGNRFRETSNAIALAPVTEALAEGHKAIITGNSMFNVTGHVIRVIGGGMFATIAHNHIENFGKQLYDNTVYTNFSSTFPATGIWLESCKGAIVHSNTIAQTGSYASTTGLISGEEVCAIRLSKNSSLIDGSTKCLVKDNVIIDVPRPFLDQIGNSANRWENNLYSGNSVAVTITPTDSVLIEPDTQGSGTCILKGSTADFSSYDLQTYRWWRHGNVVTIAIYFDLAATTGGSGNITIGGYTATVGAAPPTARATVPSAQALNFAVNISGQITHSATGYTEFQASIAAGTNVIDLVEVGSNVRLPLTEARFGSASRFAVTGQYFVDG